MTSRLARASTRPVRCRPAFGCVAGALVLLAGLLASCRREPRPPELRIVLVTIDTLRYDRFADESDGSCGMPRTRSYAARGQVFENFYASSSATQPTHASLFTGLYPWQHGVFRNGMVLSAAADTLAERLAAEGFATAAVVASFPLERRFGFQQGFEEYVDEFTSVLPGVEDWGSLGVDEGRFYTLADEVTARALRLVDRTGGAKQFFWFHYFDPHSPYGDTADRTLRPEQLRRLQTQHAAELSEQVAEARRLYDWDVAYLDRALDRLLGRLLEDASSVETHVVFTADHGESLGEREVFGHGTLVSREQVHVPFFIVSPKLAPGIRQDVAGSVDVMATILSLAGLKPLESAGRDLGAPPPDGSTRAFGMVGNVSAIRDRRTGRLRLDDPLFFEAGPQGLFGGTGRRVVDEDDPMRRLESAQTRRLRRRFRSFEKSLGHVDAYDLVDEQTRKALRALGYAP